MDILGGFDVAAAISADLTLVQSSGWRGEERQPSTELCAFTYNL